MPESENGKRLERGRGTHMKEIDSIFQWIYACQDKLK